MIFISFSRDRIYKGASTKTTVIIVEARGYKRSGKFLGYSDINYF